MKHNRATLAGHFLQIQSTLIRLKKNKLKNAEEIERLHAANEMLRDCIHTIEITNECSPYTVLGIPAQEALTTSIVSSVVTFYSTLLTYYTKNQSSIPIA